MERDKLARLQAQWQRENQIAEEGRMAAVTYRRELAERKLRKAKIENAIYGVIATLAMAATFAWVVVDAFGL